MQAMCKWRSSQLMCMLGNARCLPDIIAAGQETVPKKTLDALAELPAASLNALTILLETWHRIAENSAANGMDARALAVAVTPCLAWNPPIAKEARKVPLDFRFRILGRSSQLEWAGPVRDDTMPSRAHFIDRDS